MARLNTKMQERLEPRRIDTAIAEIVKKGYPVKQLDKRIEFQFKSETVRFFPYSGWHTGKSVKDGRGLKNLLNQI